MFSNKSKEITPMEQTTKSSSASIIAAGTEITGNIVCDGDIRIDGTLNGNIQSSSKVILGPDGKVKGDLEAKQADIMGTVSGKLIITDLLNLKGKAEINGDIYTGQLQVEPTASFNGSCHMGATAVSGNRSNSLKTERGPAELTKATEDALA